MYLIYPPLACSFYLHVSTCTQSFPHLPVIFTHVSLPGLCCMGICHPPHGTLWSFPETPLSSQARYKACDPERPVVGELFLTPESRYMEQAESSCDCTKVGVPVREASQAQGPDGWPCTEKARWRSSFPGPEDRPLGSDHEATIGPRSSRHGPQLLQL